MTAEPAKPENQFHFSSVNVWTVHLTIFSCCRYISVLLYVDLYMFALKTGQWETNTETCMVKPVI